MPFRLAFCLVYLCVSATALHADPAPSTAVAPAKKKAKHHRKPKVGFQIEPEPVGTRAEEEPSVVVGKSRVDPQSVTPNEAPKYGAPPQP